MAGFFTAWPHGEGTDSEIDEITDIVSLVSKDRSMSGLGTDGVQWWAETPQIRLMGGFCPLQVRELPCAVDAIVFLLVIRSGPDMRETPLAE